VLDLAANVVRVKAPKIRRHIDAAREARDTIANLREDGGVNGEVKERKELKESRATLNPRSKVGCRCKGAP
jgi:hypothetical protein